MEKRITKQMDQRFEEVNQRFEQVNQCFEEVNHRFDTIEQKLDVIRAQVAHNSEQETIVMEIQDLVKQHDIDIKVMKKAIGNQ